MILAFFYFQSLVEETDWNLSLWSGYNSYFCYAFLNRKRHYSCFQTKGWKSCLQPRQKESDFIPSYI